MSESLTGQQLAESTIRRLPDAIRAIERELIRRGWAYDSHAAALAAAEEIGA